MQENVGRGHLRQPQCEHQLVRILPRHGVRSPPPRHLQQGHTTLKKIRIEDQKKYLSFLFFMQFYCKENKSKMCYSFSIIVWILKTVFFSLCSKKEKYYESEEEDDVDPVSKHD